MLCCYFNSFINYVFEELVMNKEIKEYIKIRLVPISVFGAEDGYGLCDAVQAWSDCNRAYGKMYRVDDLKSYRNKGESVDVLVKKEDMEFFNKQWEADKESKPNKQAYLQGAKDMAEAVKIEECSDGYYPNYVRGHNEVITAINTKAQQFIDSLEGKE